MTETSTGRRQIQAPAGSPYSRILGFGSYRPSRVVSNEEMCTMIESTPEWIEQRTGITERRWANADETVMLMSKRAGEQAMERAGLTPDEVDTVIVATVSHHQTTPGLAPQLAQELGAGTAAAYDVSAACAGFCYGIAQADALVRSGASTNVLVVGVEKLSEITDLTDRGTAFLFADGAGAAIVGPSDTPGIGPVVWGSEGEAAEVIHTPMIPDYEGEGMPKLHMDGRPVFKWASTTVARKTLDMLHRAGISVDDLEVFIPHQANNRITDAMIRTLKLPEHVTVARDIKQQGNTSAASIPLAIETLYAEGQGHSGQIALIVGFGAGLVYAGQVIVLP
ncbi:3-oxoacyl-ACP synthase [Enemella evansiae]|uniref:Beta-ketoacyl-[acyl-carrier-protein] synthase III n=1 Tax=Enemella evansiae TaxID=2016499 RepID=A0A255FVZ4_9ACTN|nr:beta-ketoacyl-ACP synthase III [Enemella evansiae]OYN93765.1 3-oxoacyl-ACP synthase [Enemella evansiae]OYO07858.1 3-oxoacyl-ACP synthase [Enemella evansiae]